MHQWATSGDGNVRSDGDLLLEDAVVSENNQEAVFDPAASYAYDAEPATTALAAEIAAGSGPRAEYCAP